MGQIRLSSIAIIDTERSYASCSFQESDDRIINIFGKRKKCKYFLSKTLESWMRSVYVLIVVLYCVKKIGSIALLVP